MTVSLSNDQTKLQTSLEITHHTLQSDKDFHDRPAWVFRFVVKREFLHDRTK
jgi:hypothetical protein